MVRNIKKWIEKCVYDVSEILFEKIMYPNKPLDQEIWEFDLSRMLIIF